MATKTITLPDSAQQVTSPEADLSWAVLGAPVPAAQLLANAESGIDASTSAIEALELALQAPTVRFEDEIPSEHPDIPTLIPALLGDTNVRVVVDGDLRVIDFRDIPGDEWGAFVPTGQDLIEALTAEAQSQIANHLDGTAQHHATVSAVEDDPRHHWRVMHWSATERSARRVQSILEKHAAPGATFTVVEAS